MMNGAESLVRTLLDERVDVCFTNPGTSEMHFVAALDRVPGMRCVLSLFEGVVTVAADGYWRIARRPASTLLHLGPGLANLHNAKKARLGVLNVVGEHAIAHVALDAPLTSDIEGIARPMSHWVRTIGSAGGVESATRDAVQAASTPPGRIATLVLPADCAWTELPADAALGARIARLAPAACSPCGSPTSSTPRRRRSRPIATCCWWAPPSRCPFSRTPTNAAGRRRRARALLRWPTPRRTCSARSAALADAVGAQRLAPAGIARYERAAAPEGAMSIEGIGRVVAALMPEHAIVVDESVSSGRGFGAPTANAAPHDWLKSTDGASGFGLPTAIGAAIAAPDRKVLALEGDGRVMYTVQSLWTMAREGLDVTVPVFANRAYRILQGEYVGVGAGTPGPRATDMLSLDRPTIDWVGLARSIGVEAGRGTDLSELARELSRGVVSRGPYLVEAVL